MSDRAGGEAELTESDVAAFRKSGWLSLQQATTRDELEWLGGIYDELFESRACASTGEVFDLAGVPERLAVGCPFPSSALRPAAAGGGVT
jgi:hypothetical protein